jgi:folate-dependent phosphoribosylglycinamide formyltransferase PurN
MRVAGFMSGSGTNIIKIIEYQNILWKEGYFPNKGYVHFPSPYQVVFLFSDRTDFNKCKVAEISKRYNIPYEANDIREFYQKRSHQDRRNMGIRREYDKITLGFLKKYEIDCVALCGYMSIVTEVIFDNFPTINVHPADLTILSDEGKRKYTGEHAVRDAIIAGEKFVASSTHLATAEVDDGPLLLVSKPVEVKLPAGMSLEDLRKEENKEKLEEISDLHQDKLKEAGDWIIFPKTLEFMSKGIIEKDENGKIFVAGRPAPFRS